MKGLGWLVYKAVRGLARVFFPRPELVGLENIPDEGCVLVGNHAQMHGPVLCELYLPFKRAIWCTGEMMHLKEVPKYARTVFWGDKPKRVKWLYGILSYIIAPFSAAVFNNAYCIGVYRDARLTGTFRKTLEKLSEGSRVVIFPESPTPRNAIIYEFHDRFIALGRMFARQAGKSLAFVPMYVTPALRKICFGKPVYYDPASSPEAEMRRVCDALMAGVTELGTSLPRHRVVPFWNLPKKDYPMNRPEEE